MKTCTCILELSVNYRVFGLGVYQKILFFPMKIINMRYHLFLHHRWFVQNLGKDFIPTNMHTTVLRSKMKILSNQLSSSCENDL